MIRLLLLCAWLPPAVRPQAILIGRLIGQLHTMQVDITVLTDDPGDAEVVGANVVRYKKRGGVFQVLANRLFYPFEFRHVGCMHAAAVDRAKELHAEQPFDLIVAFSNPFHVNILGAIIAQRLRVPLIAHYSDPFVDNPYKVRPQRVAQRAHATEQKLLALARAVVFCNSQLADNVLARPAGRRPALTQVIEHSFVAQPDVHAPVSRAPDAGVLIRHLGAFYGPRTPSPLFAALQRLNETEPQLLARLRVELIGPDLYGAAVNVVELAAAAGLTHIVVCRPTVAHSAAFDELLGADILLSVDADVAPNIFLPSKLIEYFGARRPILCLTARDSPAYVLCNQVGAEVAPLDDVDGIVSSLRAMLGSPARGLPEEAATAPFEARNVALRWRALFESVLAQRA